MSCIHTGRLISPRKGARWYGVLCSMVCNTTIVVWGAGRQKEADGRRDARLH
jgi:hypothetical protein